MGGEAAENELVAKLGPTVPRWRLGVELYQLRQAAGVSEATIAAKLACPVNRIGKIEAGYLGVGRAELLLMLGVYGADEPTREALLDLSKLGKQRGWWSEGSKLSQPFSTFLALEAAATAVHVYEPLVVYGLAQTDEYARALIEATWTPGATEVDRQLELGRQRREQVFSKHVVSVILGESALRQVVGNKQIMRDQLAYLLDLATGQIKLQVLPLSVANHPGSLGAFTLFKFPEDVHAPVIYVESQAGNSYLEKPDDVIRCSSAFNQLSMAALNPTESADLMAAVVKEMA